MRKKWEMAEFFDFVEEAANYMDELDKLSFAKYIIENKLGIDSCRNVRLYLTPIDSRLLVSLIFSILLEWQDWRRLQK